jgi:adenosine kinase
VEQAGFDPVVVGPVPDARLVEPTGSGDAFRCGFLAAMTWGLTMERAAQLGNLMAVHVLETVGPQEYELKNPTLVERLESAYGPVAAEEVAAHLG